MSPTGGWTNDIEAPVTDSEIRAYLADRWSRSQPKEAALDNMEDGVWEYRQAEVQEHRQRTARTGREKTAGTRAAANDNALARIARDIRRTALGWRHGPAVAAFAAGRREVLASYDDLRMRTRDEGDAVALGGAFRETLTRHAVLLKQAETFRARPADFSSQLAERGGISAKELDAFEELHDRARRHRRAATMRHVHRIKRQAERRGLEPEVRQGVPLPQDSAIGPEAVVSAEPVQSIRQDGEAQSRAHDATAEIKAPTPMPEPAKPAWRPAYAVLAREWNALSADARKSGTLSFYARGYAELIPRIRAFAENADIPAATRAPMIQALKNHERHTSTRKHVENYLDRADRHMDQRDALRRVAASLDIETTGIVDYPEWRREAERLTAEGEAMLSDRKTYGAHLGNIAIGETRLNWALSNFSRAIQRDDDAVREAAEQARERQQPEQPAPPETAEDRERQALEEAHEYSRLHARYYEAKSQEEASAARQALDDYLKRMAKKYETPGEKKRQTRKMSRRMRMRP